MNRFFVTGGTLAGDVHSYVTRRADKELFDALQSGQFCYVLNTRQVGKSSLMIRAARALRTAGQTAVVLDITAGGFNLTPEAWYDGLLLQLSEQVARFLKRPELEELIESAFAQHPVLGPAQRFFHVLERVALPATGTRGFTVFVDEIDAVRLLPFSADEFFVGIRALYNRRVEVKALEKLTFCLIGVATPNQLISDSLVSPFNIGTKITLTDFTLLEAAPLAQCLPGGIKTLERVLYWTGGHPYLTQRLCAHLAENKNNMGSVDAAVEKLFFTQMARKNDDNLAFVATRLLRGEGDLTATLDLYGKVRLGRLVLDDATSPLCDALHLTGIVRQLPTGRLAVRNRLYARVFDRAWVRENLPEGELRRQRAAFRRGALRVGALSGGIIAAMGGLTAWALRNAHRADKAADRADLNRRLAETNAHQAKLNESRAKQLSGERAVALIEKEEALRAKETALREREAALAAEKTARGAADRATSLVRTNLGRVELDLALRALGNAETEAAGQHLQAALREGKLTPEQKRLASFYQETLRTFAPRLRRKITCPGIVSTVTFSSDSSKIAVGTTDGWVQVFDCATGKPLTKAHQHGASITTLAFLPGGRIASGGQDSRIQLWGGSAKAQKLSLVHTTYPSPISQLTSSRDGKKLISSGKGGCVVWDTQTGKELSRIWDDDLGGPWTAQKPSPISIAYVAQFSNSQETQLAFGAYGYVCNLADVVTGKMTHGFSPPLGAPQAAPDWIYQFVPSPQPGIVAAVGHYRSGSGNGGACLYNLETGRAVSSMMPANQNTRSGSFTSDGNCLAVGSEAGDIVLWEPKSNQPPEGPYNLYPAHHYITQLAWLPDDDRLLSQTPFGPVLLWSRKEKRVVTSRFPGSHSFALAPDKSQVAILGTSSTLVLWEIPASRPSKVLRIIPTALGPSDQLVAKDSYAWCQWINDLQGSSIVVDLETYTVLWQHNSPGAPLVATFSPNRNFLGIYSDNSAEVWDMKRQQLIRRTVSSWSVSTGLAWHHDKAILSRKDGSHEVIPLR